MNQVMGRLALMCKCISFSLLVPLQTYIWQKKNWALLTKLLKVTNILHYGIHSQENGRQIKRVK